MIKKTVYIVSLLSLILLAILTVDMLPFIFKSHFQGIFFLILVITLLIVELFMLIRCKNFLKSILSYNIFIILITLYVTIVYYKIYVNEMSFLYSIDLLFLKKNYLFLNIALIVIFLDLWVISGETKGKKY